MFKSIPNQCRWWQRHQWSRWHVREAVSVFLLTGRETDCTVQVRECQRCGYQQVESLR